MQPARTVLGVHAAEAVIEQLPRRLQPLLSVILTRDPFGLRTTALFMSTVEGDMRSWQIALSKSGKVPETFQAQLVVELL